MKSETRFAIFLGLLFFVALLFLNRFNCEFFLQPFVNPDNGTHFRQLVGMFQGAIHLDPVQFFSFHLNYGLPFFLYHFLIALPVFVWAQWASPLALYATPWLVFVTKMGTAFWASLGVMIAYLLFHKTAKNAAALFFITLMIIAPPFWEYATVFKPDWMVTILIWAMCLALMSWSQKNEWPIKKIAVILGVAIAIKTQALQYGIILPAMGVVAILSGHSWRQVMKDMLQSVGIVVGIFIVCNPHVLHPAGFFGIVRRFWFEMGFFTSGQTSLSSQVVGANLGHRIQVLADFFPLPLWALMVGILVWTWVRSWRLKTQEDRVQAVFSVVVSANMIWLIGFTHVLLSRLFMGVIPMVFVGCIPVFNSLRSKLVKGVLMGAVLTLMGVSYFPVHWQLWHPKIWANDTRIISQNERIIQTLKPFVRPTDHVLVHPSFGVPFHQLGLSATQVDPVWGDLQQDHVDAASFAQKWKAVARYRVKRFYPKVALVLPAQLSETSQKRLNQWVQEGRYQQVYTDQQMQLFVLSLRLKKKDHNSE